MKNNDDRSYERYKQYRQNKYRYEQEQILFPLAIIVGGAILIGFLEYILTKIAVFLGLTAVGVLLHLYLRKQLKSQQAIVLTKEDATEGVVARIDVTYASQQVSFVFDIPPMVKDGQKFVAKNILFKNKKGKSVQKNIHFKVHVLEKENPK